MSSIELRTAAKLTRHGKAASICRFAASLPRVSAGSHRHFGGPASSLRQRFKLVRKLQLIRMTTGIDTQNIGSRAANFNSME